MITRKSKLLVSILYCILFVLFSFIWQGTSTRRQRNDPFCIQVKLPPVTTFLILMVGWSNPLSALPSVQGHNSWTCRPKFSLSL